MGYFIYWVFCFNICMITFYVEMKYGGDKERKQFWGMFGSLLLISILFGWLTWPFLAYATYSHYKALDNKPEDE